jgi:hypothetical protein
VIKVTAHQFLSAKRPLHDKSRTNGKRPMKKFRLRKKHYLVWNLVAKVWVNNVTSVITNEQKSMSIINGVVQISIITDYNWQPVKKIFGLWFQ